MVICSHDSRLEYLKIYSWYSEDLAVAITAANTEYERALHQAVDANDYSKQIIIANINFNKFLLDIINNCTDTNNTMCKSNGDVPLDNFETEPWMYFALAIFALFIIISIRGLKQSCVPVLCTRLFL